MYFMILQNTNWNNALGSTLPAAVRTLCEVKMPAIVDNLPQPTTLGRFGTLTVCTII